MGRVYSSWAYLQYESTYSCGCKACEPIYGDSNVRFSPAGCGSRLKAEKAVRSRRIYAVSKQAHPKRTIVGRRPYEQLENQLTLGIAPAAF